MRDTPEVARVTLDPEWPLLHVGGIGIPVDDGYAQRVEPIMAGVWPGTGQVTLDPPGGLPLIRAGVFDVNETVVDNVDGALEEGLASARFIPSSINGRTAGQSSSSERTCRWMLAWGRTDDADNTYDAVVSVIVAASPYQPSVGMMLSVPDVSSASVVALTARTIDIADRLCVESTTPPLEAPGTSVTTDPSP